METIDKSFAEVLEEAELNPIRDIPVKLAREDVRVGVAQSSGRINPIEALIKYFEGVIRDAFAILPSVNDDTVIVTMTLSETRELVERLRAYVK